MITQIVFILALLSGIVAAGLANCEYRGIGLLCFYISLILSSIYLFLRVEELEPLCSDDEVESGGKGATGNEQTTCKQ